MIIEDENGRAKCVCNICEHKWYPRGNKVPWKCSKVSCQSTKWNDDNMLMTQLDQLALLRELERRNRGDNSDEGDEYGMDVESRVRKTVDQMRHEENLHRSLHEITQEVKSLKERLVDLDECPSCHNQVPSNARQCPYCPAEFDQGDE